MKGASVDEPPCMQLQYSNMSDSGNKYPWQNGFWRSSGQEAQSRIYEEDGGNLGFRFLTLLDIPDVDCDFPSTMAFGDYGTARKEITGWSDRIGMGKTAGKPLLVEIQLHISGSNPVGLAVQRQLGQSATTSTSATARPPCRRPTSTAL